MKWIKDLRSTERGRTLFKLLIYLLFLFFVIVLCLSSGALNELDEPVREDTSELEVDNKKEENRISYFEKQNLLTDGTYNFEYTISSRGKEFSFVGKYTNGLIDGFKESEEELVHYVVEEGITYKIEGEERIIYEELYAGVNVSFFDFKNLFAMLNGSTAAIS